MTDYHKIQKQYYSKEWEKIELKDKPGMTGWRTSVPNKEIAEFIKYLKDHKVTKGKVLDLGCGGGRYAIAYAQNGFEIYGIDFAPAAIKKARYNINQYGLSKKVHLRVGDALKLTYPNDYFDVVNDDGCFHHIIKDDWKIYRNNLVKVLKVGGYYRLKVLSTKSKLYKKSKDQKNSHWLKIDGGYTHFFTKTEILNLFDKDFEILYIKERQHHVNPNTKFIFAVMRKKKPDDMYKKVKQFVDESFSNASPHFERTVYWLKQLKPNADEAMLIAAYAHDIERAFDRATMNFWKTRNLNDAKYLEKHQNGWAKIITKFLQKNKYPKEDTKRIAEMIRLHEFGGTKESDLIKDADSISYFEVNAPKHIEKFGKPLGKEKLLTKYNFMFNRITNKKAKTICKKWYNDLIKKVEKEL